MTANRKLGAVALLSLGFCFSADAGVIKSSFTATETRSRTQTDPTETIVTTDPPKSSTVSIKIFERKKSVNKIVVTETWTDGVETEGKTSTFTPFGSSYLEKTDNTYSSLGSANSYSSTNIGKVKVRVTAPRKRGRKLSGGKVYAMLTEAPYTSSSSYSDSSGASQDSYTSESSTTIQATFKRRPSLTYKKMSSSNDTTTNSMGTYSTVRSGLTTGEGKAKGKITP